MQTPAIAVTGRNVMPAFMGAYRAVAMVDVGGEFVYQNSHGNRLFKSVDHTWCLKSMTPNDNGVETRNGRGSPSNRRRFYCGRHFDSSGQGLATEVTPSVQALRNYSVCGPHSGTQQCSSCQRYQSSHPAWFTSAAMPTGTRTWNVDETAVVPVIATHGIMRSPGTPQSESAAAFNKVAVDSSQPLEVTLTLARYAAAAASTDPSLYFRRCQNGRTTKQRGWCICLHQDG